MDDRADYRALLADVFAPAGYAIESAANAREGLARFREHPPERWALVVSDISMPGPAPIDGELAGLRLTRALRRNGYRGPIVLASTGFDNWFGILLQVALRPLVEADWLIPKGTLRRRNRSPRSPRFYACRSSLPAALLFPIVMLARALIMRTKVVVLPLLLGGLLISGCARALNDLPPERRRAAAEYYTTEGRQALQDGHLGTALALLSEAIRVDPRYAEGYWQRARLYQAIDEPELVAADLWRARYLKPANRQRALTPIGVAVSEAELSVVAPAPLPDEADLRQALERQRRDEDDDSSSSPNAYDSPWQFRQWSIPTPSVPSVPAGEKPAAPSVPSVPAGEKPAAPSVPAGGQKAPARGDASGDASGDAPAGSGADAPGNPGEAPGAQPGAREPGSTRSPEAPR